MEPTLRADEYVLVAPGVQPTVGSLALARHPDRPAVSVVKRVIRIETAGWHLASDNPDAGTDSRHWGLVDPTAVVGAVTLCLDRPLASLAPPTSAESGKNRSWVRWLRR